MTTSNSRPGDMILGRYMPNASEAEREKARANLYAFVAVLVRIARRRTEEELEGEIRAEGAGEVESVDSHSPTL